MGNQLRASACIALHAFTSGTPTCDDEAAGEYACRGVVIEGTSAGRLSGGAGLQQRGHLGPQRHVAMQRGAEGIRLSQVLVSLPPRHVQCE